jgi:peptide/nickel transport system substrate-binding protein
MAWDPPSPGELATLSQSFPSQLHQNPVGQTYYLWLNVRSAPFDNLLARRAVDYAVDRGALARFALGPTDGGRPTCQLLPPDFPGYVPYCPYRENLLKAQQLVRESGTDGARVKLILPSYVARGLGQQLLASLRAIGYHARLTYLSVNKLLFGPPAFLSRFQAGFNGWAVDYLSPAQIIPYIVECSLHPGPNDGNLGRFCNPGLDAQIASALREEPADPGLASLHWTAIDHEIVNQAADVPLDNPLQSDFVARRVGDYQYNPQWGVLVDQLWVR